ncbi:MAG: hypothetical protein ACNA8W_24180 [Bradymonadaceae bacterium]
MTEPSEELQSPPDEPFEASREMRRRNWITAAIIMAIVLAFIVLALSGVTRS